jgi:hypothetical protein
MNLRQDTHATGGGLGSRRFSLHPRPVEVIPDRHTIDRMRAALLGRRRLPPVVVCDAGCASRSRDHGFLGRPCPNVGCAGVMRALRSLGWKAYACSYCRGTGRAEDGGEAHRCSACNGDGWRVVK